MTGARLVDLALGWARQDGARDMIVDGPARLTYREFGRQVQAVAACLTRAGLRPGARVAFLGGPGAAFLLSELATHLAGGVWLGLSPRYTASELEHVLVDAAPSLVVIDSDHDDAALLEALARLRLPPAVQQLARFADLLDVPAPLPAPALLLPPEVALLVYTSGTTGVPKGAMLTHAGMIEAARLYADRYGHPNMRSVMNLPINHVGALIDLVAPAIHAGGALVMMRAFDPASIPDLMRDERVTLLGQVPAMHLAIEAAAPYDPEALPHLQHLIWSGAAMPRPWIEARHGGRVQLSTCYGLTECTGSVTFTQAGAGVDELADTVGRPAHEGLVQIVGADGRAVPAGEPGEVQVRGPLVMAGYLGNAAATSEAISPDGWLATGDLGLLDGDGALRLVGRLKEMFKSGGYNVYPREVETVLEAHPAVNAAAVIGMPDARWQEVGWAFVLAKGDIAEAELDAHARLSLANFKVPKRFVVRHELPLLPIGKIDKRALKRAAIDGAYG